MMINTKAYEYCKANINKKTTPKYVKKTMRVFMRISEDKDKKYKISETRYKQIEGVLKLLIMPKGLKAGMTLYECTTGYQWLIYTAVLCTVYRDNEQRRRYETCILEICRKNFKTYTVGTLFIILFITEPNFSDFYSVAPDGKLSREIKEAITKTIKSSPLIYEYKGVKRFKLLRDYIEFLVKESKYTPLNYSNSNMDGKLPSVFCADEVGALPNTYAIEAMQSGQLNILNKLGFIISTKYPTIDNPIEIYDDYAKKILDGVVQDDTVFSLLYVPDTNNWETDDLVLKQANPVALEIPEIWQDLLKKRAKAVAMESARENFVTKHCNIVYQGAGTETYIDTKDVQKCKVSNIDWAGRVVYLGVDLSESNDNTSVAMVAIDDEENILAEVVAFIPDGRIEEKNAFEKIDYKEFIRAGKAIACGDKVIDYAVVEDYILAIEEKYNVQVQAIGYDRYNALSTAQKLERAGYNTIEIRQHSSVLHPPTKRLREKILSGEFQYTENKLLEINFQNARCTYDTNKNLYVNKKKSKGKVDMVVAMINATYLLEQDYFLNQADFTIQVL